MMLVVGLVAGYLGHMFQTQIVAWVQAFFNKTPPAPPTPPAA